jgi:fermentation-respiration switch protein FrsA (DUF1100 family)
LNYGVTPLGLLLDSPGAVTITVCPFDAQISEPVLFLSGLKDEMVPPSHMRRLYIAAQRNSGYRSFVEFPHGMHMDTWMRGGEHYWKSIESFMKQHTAGETTLQNGPTEVDGGPQLVMKEG